MTVYAITDTKKGRTGIAPTYLQTTQIDVCFALLYFVHCVFLFAIATPEREIFTKETSPDQRDGIIIHHSL